MKKLFKPITNLIKSIREYANQAHLKCLKDEAAAKVNVRYNKYYSWIYINDIAVLRITNETNIQNGTIALDEVAVFVESIRSGYIDASKKE